MLCSDIKRGISPKSSQAQVMQSKSSLGKESKAEEEERSYQSKKKAAEKNRLVKHTRSSVKGRLGPHYFGEGQEPRWYDKGPLAVIGDSFSVPGPLREEAFFGFLKSDFRVWVPSRVSAAAAAPCMRAAMRWHDTCSSP